MLRKLTLLVLPLVLLAAACKGSDAGAPSDADGGPQPTPTEVAREVDGGPGSDDLSRLPLGAPNPLGLLGSSQGTFGPPDQALAALLLRPDDLPDEFISLGEYGFSAPTDLGTMEMAAGMFSTAGFGQDDLGVMVMSAAAALPPDARGQVGLTEWTAGLRPEDLEEMEAAGEALGIDFRNLRVLDTAGLGEGGAGLHMEMDFSDLMSQLDVPSGQTGGLTGIAMDLYTFVRGERMLMLMVMWPEDMSSGVDARALAEVMDARADLGS